MESVIEEFGDNIEGKAVLKEHYPGECEVEELKDEEPEEFTSSLTQWASIGSNTFTGCGNTSKTLDAGYYEIDRVHGNIVFRKQLIQTDDLLLFPDSNLDSIITEINDFWNRAEVFKQYGFLHRRGYMLFGPAGSGKSCLIKQISSNLIKDNGIVINGGISPKMLTQGVRLLREIEPNRNIICIFEDIDAIIRSYGEEEVLSFLDGESLTDHVLNIATTNYPERLDKRIVARPRRFDRLLKIDLPNDAMRALFFSKKLQIEKKELSTYVEATEGFSFAAMSELIISTKCLGNEFDESVATLKNLLSKKVTSEDFNNDKPGFGRE